MKAILLSSLVAVLCCSCNSYLYLPAETQPSNVEITYEHGAPTAIRSEYNGADVYVDLSSEGNSNMNLRVYLQNNSDSAFTFIPENLLLTGFDATGKKARFRVFEADEYRRIKRNQRIAIGAVVIAATITTAAIIANNTDNHSHPGDYSYYDNNWALWSSSITPPIIINCPVNYIAPKDGLVRRQTIYPGEVLQGSIKIRGKQAFLDKLLVELSVNGAYHKFVFDRRVKR